MCGIAGTWLPEYPSSRAKLAAEAMGATLGHRGPDALGSWSAEVAPVAMAHRRLAVIDLSEAGHQPMVSGSGRMTVCYNGEIYNHDELRADLRKRGREFRGLSDTEVLCEALDEWGVAETAKRLVGMFAFAVWDAKERTLSLVRDRMGEKPLFYAVDDGAVFFASELKAFDVVGDIDQTVDRQAVEALLGFGFIPGAMSIFENIRKVRPGHIVELSRVNDRFLERQEKFWCLLEVADAGIAKPWVGSRPELDEQLEGMIRRSLAGQLVADVPLGAFLSGGIDSPTIVAIASKVASRPVRTFTAGFDDERFSEVDAARRIAGFLGTDHTEMIVRAQEAIELIPEIPGLFDEPLGDSSQIPMILLSRLMREHVTVAISADGGDELFGGYESYRRALALWSLLRLLPARARGGIRRVGERPWFESFLRSSLSRTVVGHRISRLVELLDAGSAEEVFRGMTRHWPTGSVPIPGGGSLADCREALPEGLGDDLLRMSFTDAACYLPDNVMTKVDRSAMAASLETRAPLLDHRIVEFSFRLPQQEKLSRGVTKLPLRRILSGHLPASVTSGPKRGFSVPLAGWLRGPLRGWADGLLSKSSIEDLNLIDPEPIQIAWREHLSGDRDWKYRLWPVLMLAAWHQARRGLPPAEVWAAR